jgi:hypothetical protein
MELLHGSKWRSDTAFSRPGGKKGTSLKASWSMQKPIYLYIEQHIQSGNSEEQAIELVQEVFDSFAYRQSGKPKLKECRKEFVARWGILD